MSRTKTRLLSRDEHAARERYATELNGYRNRIPFGSLVFEQHDGELSTVTLTYRAKTIQQFEQLKRMLDAII